MTDKRQPPTGEEWEKAKKRGWQFRCRDPELYAEFTARLESGEISSVNGYLNDLVEADLKGSNLKRSDFTRGEKIDLIEEWSRDQKIYSTILAEFLKSGDEINSFAYAMLSLDYNGDILEPFLEIIKKNYTPQK